MSDSLPKFILLAFISAKGGVGKSTTAWLSYQYFLTQGITPIAVDADPHAPSFYRSLKGKDGHAHRLSLLNSSQTAIDRHKFDDFVETIEAETDSGNTNVVILDIGSNAFTAASSYFEEINVDTMLASIGCEFWVCAPFRGTPASHSDTSASIDAMIDAFDNVIVLDNGYGDDATIPLPPGLSKSATEIMTYPNFSELTDTTITQLMSKSLTLQEASASKDVSLPDRTRAREAYQTLFIDHKGFFPGSTAFPRFANIAKQGSKDNG